MKVDFKEKTTERYLGQVFQGFADVLSGGALLECQ